VTTSPHERHTELPCRQSSMTSSPPHSGHVSGAERSITGARDGIAGAAAGAGAGGGRDGVGPDMVRDDRYEMGAGGVSAHGKGEPS